ncbi:MAG: tRNA (adenosine(37)-N6)-dimethylallyltransferase MiaA, partial [Anaeroplasmataceae bacterium]|nr:tRNA (adenosine(37)-N6)-dimethylallyltransferase MiaA [Anaeroplasmataceae bacterium]
NRELLYERIQQRVDQMLEDGLFEEVKALKDQNVFPKGIGYREWIPYFEGKISFEDAVDDITINTRHLAKRQATWFKNQMQSHFYLIEPDYLEETYQRIEADIDRWLEE